jgi:hypothetical protein
MTKIRKRYPSLVLTSEWASMRVCHLRTRDLSLSLVKDIPEKLVRQFLPWTSSTRSLILRKACSSSFWRSARETSKTRPLRASLADSKGLVGGLLNKIHTQTSRSIHEGLANLFDVEDSWGLDIIPEKQLAGVHRI